jgi:two-component system, NarL family, sensor histidine kinase UhpB
MPLYWRVCLTNGLVFVLGIVVLAVSPATISSDLLVSEAVVLGVGTVVILLANAVLLRGTLVPLDRLVRAMESVQRPGERPVLPTSGSGAVRRLVASFEAMLDRLDHERSRSTARALAAQEAERHRIAQELHDEVGQSLTVVLLQLKHLADRLSPQEATFLEDVRESVRTGLDEVREVARRLRPGVLEDLGLLSALAALATDFSARTGVHVSRTFAPGLPSATKEVELVVYRVAQEALTNTARHAGAETVELLLTVRGGALMLVVADDGRGVRGRPEGAGVAGMRERAALVGGRLEMGSRDGGGTEVRLLVPPGGRDA